VHITKSHRAYFKAAKSMSELSNFKQHHIGAVAVYGHKIISSGCNSYKTNPMQKRLNIHRFDADTPATLHAELSCLLPLISRKDIDFSNVSLYIYREYKNGELALARPCASCEALIRSLGIRNIYYTGNRSYISEEIIY
jgi:deoxycytidylate deaminase